MVINGDVVVSIRGIMPWVCVDSVHAADGEHAILVIFTMSLVDELFKVRGVEGIGVGEKTSGRCGDEDEFGVMPGIGGEPRGALKKEGSMPVVMIDEQVIVVLVVFDDVSAHGIGDGVDVFVFDDGLIEQDHLMECIFFKELTIIALKARFNVSRDGRMKLLKERGAVCVGVGQQHMVVIGHHDEAMDLDVVERGIVRNQVADKVFDDALFIGAQPEFAANSPGGGHDDLAMDNGFCLSHGFPPKSRLSQ